MKGYVEKKDRVYIVGCGPDGAPAYDRIDPDCDVILCNAAINLLNRYTLPKAIWMVSDHNFIKTESFIRHYERYAHLLHGSAQVAKVCTVARQWQENPWMIWGDVSPICESWRGGGSIVGCALHRAYWRGQQAILCGVDMHGTYSLSHPGVDYYAHDHWKFKLYALNTFIDRFMPDTRTISETALTCKPL